MILDLASPRSFLVHHEGSSTGLTRGPVCLAEATTRRAGYLGHGQLVQAATVGTHEERAALRLPSSTPRAGPSRLSLAVVTEGPASEDHSAGSGLTSTRASGRSGVPRGRPAASTAGRTVSAHAQPEPDSQTDDRRWRGARRSPRHAHSRVEACGPRTGRTGSAGSRSWRCAPR
jgi:hypothetical protein